MYGYSFPTQNRPKVVAAIDLGSNSFHMIIARIVDGHVQIIDKAREMVRLAAGLDENRTITPEAEERALACLSRFGQRLKDMPEGSVRAVGTNTLRAAHNGEAFRTKAEQALGHSIEVIAGREEARLVYLGVAQGLQADDRSRLVVDIGGGSTELIVGEGFRTVKRESTHMGCVSMTVRHFANGKITEEAMRRAVLDARLELRPIQYSYRDAGWTLAVGSSGTIKSIGSILKENDITDGTITLDGMKQLRTMLIEAGHMDKLNLKGLSEERRPVFVGGFAVLMGVFIAIGVEEMLVSREALREGLIYDTLGRIGDEDTRERTVKALTKRFGLDKEQARRVRHTAADLLKQVAHDWELEGSEAQKMLIWAARLHELGNAVSHTQYHKHGAYLLANADMSGFSRQDQTVLAALVRGHRRKFPISTFEELPESVRTSAYRLCVLLRLSVLLHRGRSDRKMPYFTLTADKQKLRLQFHDDWLDSHPLSHNDLNEEAERLAPAGFKLRIRQGD